MCIDLSEIRFLIRLIQISEKVPTCCSCHIDSYKEKFPPISSYNGVQDDYRFSASNINNHRQHAHYPTQQSISPYATILTSNEPQLDDSSASGSSNSEEDDSIAYQFSNGFKRSPSKPHHGKYRNSNSHHGTGSSSSSNSHSSHIGGSSDSSSSGTANKPLRLDKPRKPIASVLSFAPVSPTLDSYLTPPTSESEFDFVSPFKRGGTVHGSSSSATFDRGEIDIGSVSTGGNGGSSSGGGSGGQRNRNRRPVRTNNHDQTIAGSDYTVTHQTHHHPHPLLLANTAFAPAGITPDAAAAAGAATASSSGVLSSTVKRQSTTALSGTIGGSVASGKSTSFHPQRQPSSTATLSTLQHQLPSISTASTSAIDLGKRVNYNYHPIIDFFGDSLKSAKEIDDRVGMSETTRTWRPMAVGGGGGGSLGGLGPMRRRPHRR